jgi:hypothetical protein
MSRFLAVCRVALGAVLAGQVGCKVQHVRSCPAKSLRQ